MIKENRVLELFTKTSDFCSRIYDSLPASCQDKFFQETEADPELQRLMTLAESESDNPNQVRNHLRAYMRRFKEIAENYRLDKVDKMIADQWDPVELKRVKAEMYLGYEQWHWNNRTKLYDFSDISERTSENTEKCINCKHQIGHWCYREYDEKGNLGVRNFPPGNTCNHFEYSDIYLNDMKN